jgi:hypothetical protein
VRIITTATIEKGAKANRVRVKRKASASTRATVNRYRQDPAVRGMDTVITCISLPVAELDAIDGVCERVQMARSHFLRQAAKHFAAYVLGNGEQEKRWREALR